MPGPNRTAAEQTLAGYDGPAVVAQLVRSLADAVDAEPTNASLWREYRAAVADLTKREPTDADPGAELLRRLAAMGDAAEPGPPHHRRPAREGGGGDGDAVHAVAADGGGRRRRVRRGDRPPDLP